MKTDLFNIFDAVHGISDIRHLIAIMFNTTDLIFIKKVLNKSGYPFGTEKQFVKQLCDVHEMWLVNGKCIEDINGYSGMYDPFDNIEKADFQRLRDKIKF